MASRTQRRQIGELNDSFVLCRIGHRWDTVDTDDHTAPEHVRGTRMVFECGRCTMRKYEVWHSRNGAVIYRYYQRPDGYSSLGRGVQYADFRLELMRRWSHKPPTAVRARRQRRKAA